MTASETPDQTANETWTMERVDLLKGYLDAGLSCGQIASQIGVTRNAVIGKINRLGLSRGRTATGPAKQTGARTRRLRILTPRRIVQARHSDALSPKYEEPVASVTHCSLLELAKGKCRWPISDAGAENFSFCGNRSVAGLSYCAAHARIAYLRPLRRYA
jgi:GcrA cell cycle regulator